MEETFRITVIRRHEAASILAACFLPAFLVMWLLGQFFPVQQEWLALWSSFITVSGICAASYWLIKKKVLAVLLIELNPKTIKITYLSGYLMELPLISIEKYKYFVTRGTHTMCISTAAKSIKLTTNKLFGGAHSESQFQALATSLEQQLKEL